MKFQDTKVFSQIRRMKEFTTFEFECVQKSKEQKNSKQRSNSNVFENQKNERIQNVRFVQLLWF